MLKKSFFVTGTDTEVGKTFVSCALLAAANRQGLRSLALKPVAAGAQDDGEGLKNEDATALQKYASVPLSYSQINPIVFEAAIAPHIAAQKQGRSISLSRLTGLARGALSTPHDFSLVEGAGGWLVPINGREMLSDLARELNLGVILVVGLRLGCINHALLTAQAIKLSGLKLAGWVANQVENNPMEVQEDNITTLHQSLRAPCLGVVPYADSPDSEVVLSQIKLDCLLASKV